MNRERAKELLPIIEAYANGEEVQVNSCCEWTTWKTYTFSNKLEYRIKPKQREWYARPNDLHAHTPNGECEITGCIKVREVL